MGSDTIAAVKASVRIPVVANGDITSPEKARLVLAITQADAVMIGVRTARKHIAWYAQFLPDGVALREAAIQVLHPYQQSATIDQFFCSTTCVQRVRATSESSGRR